MIQYIYNILLGADQMLNAFLLGDPDEGISGRCGRAMVSGRPIFFVPYLAKVIDWFARVLTGEVNHCLNAIEHEEFPMEKELWSWERD